MMSLEDRCLNYLAESIIQMPDTIMREKLSGVCERKIKKVEKEKAEEKAIKNMVNIAVIVSDIFEDMIKAIENVHYYRKDYYKMYPKIDKNIIDIAIKNAEILVSKFSNYIIIGKKELAKFNRYSDSNSDLESDLNSNSELEIENNVYISNRDEDDYQDEEIIQIFENGYDYNN